MIKKTAYCIALGIAALVPFSVQAEKTDLELVGQQADNYFFTLSKPWILDKNYINRIAKGFCSNKNICFAHFWEKGKAKPNKFPLTNKEINAQMATYRINKYTKKEVILWSCKHFPGTPNDECFH